MTYVRLAPSILAADFTRLGEQVESVLQAGIDWIHVDVMDGHFVPNISVGPLVVRALRPLVEQYGAILDTHLMIEQPERYIEAFIEAGANRVTVHVETCPHLNRTVQMIREFGAQPGVTLNPATPLSSLTAILPDVDLVLIMSVNPGFGGQRYITRSTERIRRLQAMLAEIDSPAEIQVDGGIKPSNAAEIAAAGATVLVAGSAIFGGPKSIADNIADFRNALA